MTRKRRPDIAPSGYVITVGFVTPFIVRDSHQDEPVAAFHSLREARAHFPSARVHESAERKARELGE